jgi:penicillin amidase
MRVPAWVGFFFIVVVAESCKGSSGAPTLSVSPSGQVVVSGSQVFTATVQNTQDTVSWSLAGPGTLSSDAGYATTYVAPQQLSPTAGTATLTASVAGINQVITLELAPPVLTPQVIPGLSGSVRVEYDVQGIPHIFCSVYLDCIAVQGFVQAQDRLFEMDLFRRTGRGQLASLVGPLQVSSDQQFLTFFVTRDGQRIEDAMYKAADPQSVAVLQAFASGVNAWLGVLQQNPALIPGEYTQLPTPITTAADIPQWTPQDTLGLARLQQFQLSESLGEEMQYGLVAQTYGTGPLADPGKINSWIRCQEPVHSYTLSPYAQRESRRLGKSAYARAAPKKAVGALLAKAQARLDSMMHSLPQMGLGMGSNNWVVDAAHSANGKAMVANDPHLPLLYPPLFHLASLNASDSSGMAISGGAFPGIPGALVGRGAHVGWGVTVVGYDVTDIYVEQLTVDGQGHPAVVFNGQPVTLLPVQYTIKVRGGADQQFTVLVVPHHGPVIQFDPVNHVAISFRWSGHEGTNDLKGFFGLDLASAVGNIGDDPATSTTAFAALTAYATGAQNFVLADDQGNIGYDPHALVPLRPWAGSAPKGVPLLPWLPLPGDGTAEWGSQDAGDDCNGHPKAGCWTADVNLPWGVNPDAGFFATANSDPNGDTADNNPIINPRSPLPSYLSFDWDDPTGFRVARIAELLEQRIADGGVVSAADMVVIQTDHKMKIAEVLLPFIAAVPQSAQTPSFQSGLAMLQQWKLDGFDCPTGLSGISPSSPPDSNATHVQDGAACMLFHAFLRISSTNIFADDLAVAGAGRNGGNELRAMLYMLQSTTPASDTTFCNDVDGTGKVIATHSCEEQLGIALGSAYDSLTGALGAPSNWLWGSLHTLTTQSAAAPLISAPFQAGPFARPGGLETVDVGDIDLTSTSATDFSYGAGSNVRHVSVMDPATPQIMMQLPGAERDVPAGTTVPSPNDLLIGYVQNQYFNYLHAAQVDGQSGVVSVQTFSGQ